jgi:hypothetical protein
VVQEITSTWPSEVWDLRTELLAGSPFLSMDALWALLENPNIPMAIKLEVFIANPDATQQEDFLLKAQTESSIPLPAYAVNSIVASWEERTYRSTLEAEMAAKHTRMTQCVNRLVQHYSDGEKPDSVLWAWQQLSTNAARYAEAAMLLGLGQPEDAYTVVEDMTNDHPMQEQELEEREHMLAYLDVLLSAAREGRSPLQLNETEVGVLQTLVESHYDRPTRWAASLLCMSYGLCWPPNTGGEGEERSMVHLARVEIPTNAAPQFTLQPNPASIWCAITYRSLPADQEAELVVEDPAGRLVHRQRIASAEGQAMVDTRSFAPGMYTVRLLMPGKAVPAQRLIVQP